MTMSSKGTSPLAGVLPFDPSGSIAASEESLVNSDAGFT